MPKTCKDKEKKPHPKMRLFLLCLGSFLVSIAPLIVAVAINWGDYTDTAPKKVSLGAGGTILAVMLFLKVIGKLPHSPRRIVSAGIFLAIVWLLEPLIMDLKFLAAMFFLGELLDVILFQPHIAAARRRISVTETADETARRVAEIIESASGRV